MLPDRDDAALVRRVRSGDPVAFDAIHHRYAPSLIVVARRMLEGDHAAAEDVVQEAFLRAHRALLRDERPVALRAWLHTIVRRAAIDELRRARPEPSRAADATARGRPGEEPAALAEARAALSDAFARLPLLPRRQRTALLLHAVQGLPHDDVARRMQTTSAATRVLVHRARATLRPIEV